MNGAEFIIDGSELAGTVLAKVQVDQFTVVCGPLE